MIMRVLIAEDDHATREGLREILEGEGYDVHCAADGVEALKVFKSWHPQFVCLDIMMPGKSGYDVCREIRRTDRAIPILFISAKSEEIDKVVGLELGADDFITKPFGVREVIARIRAIARRCLRTSGSGGLEEFEFGPYSVNPAELSARGAGKELELSLRDVAILRLFHDHEGRVVTRDVLYRKCWNLAHTPDSRTLDQHISKLRKRIESDPANPTLIQTVHGLGYRYVVVPSKNAS
jgi:DNA-binding response OmpR family regulator